MQVIVTSSDDLRTIVENAVTTALGAFTPPTPPTPQATTSPDLLTRGEVLKMLRITAPTLRGMTRKGRLRPVRIGKKLLFRRTDIERFTGVSI